MINCIRSSLRKTDLDDDDDDEEDEDSMWYRCITYTGDICYMLLIIQHSLMTYFFLL